MSLCVFSTEAENDLMGVYRYGFLNYGENKADLYINALKEQCRFWLPRWDTEQQNASPSAKKSVILAGMPESSHTDVKL